MPFYVESISATCETWYKVIGNLHAPDAIPIVLLHGGPGACHDYLLPLQQLASPTPPMIFYDQVGNGRSTHLRNLRGDEAFWTVDLFMDELSNLLRHLGLSDRTFDLHGQSWGGMLAAEYAIRGAYCQQIRKLILSNSLASNALYIEGTNIEIKKFPENEQAAIRRARETGKFDTEECKDALDYFMRRLLSIAQPWPVPPLMTALEWLTKDDTTYFTMYGHVFERYAQARTPRRAILSSLMCVLCSYGPNMLSPTGALRNWSIVEELHNIEAQTLVNLGELEGAQQIASQPFIDNIPSVESVVVEGAAHMTHLDQPDKYHQIVQSFLEGA